MAQKPYFTEDHFSGGRPSDPPGGHVLPPSRLAVNPTLRKYIEERLAGQVTDAEGHRFAGPRVVWKKRRAVLRQNRRWSNAWSPEQIAHRLRIDYPEDPAMRISHETIYQSLYIQGLGALRRELTACLRSG